MAKRYYSFSPPPEEQALTFHDTSTRQHYIFQPHWHLGEAVGSSLTKETQEQCASLQADFLKWKGSRPPPPGWNAADTMAATLDHEVTF